MWCVHLFLNLKLLYNKLVNVCVVDIKLLCGDAVLHVLHHSNCEGETVFWCFIFLAGECVWCQSVLHRKTSLNPTVPVALRFKFD